MLHTAGVLGHRDIVELLVEHGADLEALDRGGWGPWSAWLERRIGFMLSILQD